MKLSQRLLAAAQLVRKGSVAADIGCDHGKLCAYLLQTGSCTHVVAADINPAPLSRAKELLESLGLAQHASFVLSNGAAALSDDITDYVIAGLGAQTTANIIDAAPEMHKRDKNLVLVPASKHVQLRRYLYDNGFELYSECAVEEYEHCYSVMGARYTGIKEEKPPLFYYVGLIEPTDAHSRAYLSAVAHGFAKRIHGLETSDADSRDSALLREMLTQTERMLRND